MSLPCLTRYPVVCVDVETTGKDWTRDRVFGVAVSVPMCSLEKLLEDPVSAPISSIYFDARKQPHLYQDLRDQARKIQLVVNHNMKFDLHMLANDQVLIDPGRTECTMIRASLINEHRMKYDLDTLAKDYLGMSKVGDIYEKLADLFGGRPTRNTQMPNLHQAPVNLVEPYAKRDTEVALRLWAWQQGEIHRQDLHQVWGLEKRLFPHIFEMERNGIRVDEDAAERQMYHLTQAIEREQKQLDRLAGFPINPNPSGSIVKLFRPKQNESGVWKAEDGTILEATPAGKPSINADALERMEHPTAAMILSLRKKIKTRDTFIGGHILGHAVKGRVHPNINQVKGDNTGGTGTGRLSYTKPALQQIPSRDKAVAEMVRPIFLPEVGHGWSYGDLDQHELRVFHHYVNNERVIQAYRENPDLDGHQVVADLTNLPRNAPKSGGANAKQVNLGMVFNMGGGELADQMGLPFTWDSFVDGGGVEHVFKKAGPEAQDVMETYHRMVPGVREIAKKARSIAKSRGYVHTIFGRHIRFPGGNFTHKASGLVYQGSSADLVKLDIINTCDYLRQECPEGRLLLSIHDEQNVSIPLDGRERQHMDAIRDLIQSRPGSPTRLRVPIRADFSIPGKNWWEATNLGGIHG